jgi:RecB family endonuclease NucS
LKERSRIKEIQVSEKELETLLIKDLSVIDTSLQYLGRQIETDSGFLDILAFDREEKSLGIIELKVKEDDGQLFQRITYYDWVRSRRELIKGSYKIYLEISSEDLVDSYSSNLF